MQVVENTARSGRSTDRSVKIMTERSARASTERSEAILLPDDHRLLHDDDADGHPIPVLILPPTPSALSSDGLSSDRLSRSSSMSFELDGENVEVRILGAASPSRATAQQHQPPCIMKLPLATVRAGLQSVGSTPRSGRLSQPLSGRSVMSVLSTGRAGQPPMSSRSAKSLSEWYQDSGRHNTGESTCASSTDHCDDMPRATTSAWLLDGHTRPDARTSETTCFKMTSTAPEYPES